MSCCKETRCAKACCSGGKMKIKIPQAKPIAMSSGVATQAVTTTSTTLLVLTPSAFSFSSFNNCNRCCNSYVANSNIFCVRESGVFLVTVLVTLDTAPNTDTVTVAIDANNNQAAIYALTGSGTTIAFSITLNLCSTDSIRFRVYSTSGYVGNVIGSNVSITKVAERVNNCC